MKLSQAPEPIELINDVLNTRRPNTSYHIICEHILQALESQQLIQIQPPDNNNNDTSKIPEIKDLDLMSCIMYCPGGEN